MAIELPTPSRPGPDAPGDRWFWESTSGTGEGRASVRGRPLEPLALLALVVGAVGLGALLVGEAGHRGAPVDLTLAALAMGGTLASIVLGRLGLARVAARGRSARGRSLAFLALAEGWLSVLLVLLFGLHAIAAP